MDEGKISQAWDHCKDNAQSGIGRTLPCKMGNVKNKVKGIEREPNK